MKHVVVDSCSTFVSFFKYIHNQHLIETATTNGDVIRELSSYRHSITRM